MAAARGLPPNGRPGVHNGYANVRAMMHGQAARWRAK